MKTAPTFRPGLSSVAGGGFRQLLCIDVQKCVWVLLPHECVGGFTIPSRISWRHCEPPEALVGVSH